jgi:hypothetical protein
VVRIVVQKILDSTCPQATKPRQIPRGTKFVGRYAGRNRHIYEITLGVRVGAGAASPA